MFIKKAVNVVAAASVAVLGVVGVVSAQAPSPILTNELGTAGNPPAQTGSMGVSYEVVLEATMQVDANSLKDKKLFVANPKSDDDAGNLGSVFVKTNYPRWDVLVTAHNNLVLTRGGEQECTPGTVLVPSTCSVVGADSLFVSGGPGGTTTGSPPVTTAGTPAVLDVYVGIVTGALPVYTPTLTRLTPTLNGTGKASFAVGISATLTAASASMPAAANITSEAGSVIGTSGFGQQIDYTKGVLFYVSGGLISGTATSIAGASPTDIVPLADGDLKGKNNGQYTETLDFTLVAAY